ncbi:MAG: carboxypeptidase-like regulatory domain-containing protein [Isosphaeraceae bacterium]
MRNVLRGQVESDAGESREGVRVTVASRTDLGLSRSGLSNAVGRFAIRLEDGDWNVRVTMPSGRVYTVRQISVRNGRVIDDEEQREIPNLIISY